ncbi:MAG: class I SAM-dependent methyltransferase [Actinomycetes bacterium]
MGTVDFRQGDYRTVADRLRPAAEQLVAWCAPGPGELVVDIAAGNGNVARQCAERGADVVAVDLVLELLRLGREDGPGVDWIAGDAHALPLRDGVAELALSTFGVIYADRPGDAVRELGRVCRSGGRIGLATWPKGGYQEGAAVALREVAGVDNGGHDHIAVWGDAEQIEARLAAVADDVEVREGALDATFPSLTEWWRSRSTTTPSIVSAMSRLDEDGRAALAQRYLDVAAECGSQTDDGFTLHDTYLVALARVR